jgi:hypothetical protein
MNGHCPMVNYLDAIAKPRTQYGWKKYVYRYMAMEETMMVARG